MQIAGLYSFDAEILYYFSVGHRDVKYEFLAQESFKDEEIFVFFSSLRDVKKNPPPYMVGVISELINQREIPLSFELRFQYVVVGDHGKTDRSVAISYDTMLAGDRALRGATFEVLTGDLVRDFIDQQLGAVFQRLESTLPAIVPDCWQSSGFIDHKIEVFGYERRSEEETVLKARSKTTFRRHPYGEYASAYVLPTFPRPEDKDQTMYPIVLAGYKLRDPPSPPAVLARELSEIVKQNLEALELGMSNPKAVFIQGEPGSGKEGFATAIHKGSRLDLMRGERPPFSSRSVAGMDFDLFKREVLGEEKDGVTIAGLIAKTERGTIFLDEFDKLEEKADGAYKELLRVWEAGEYVPLNGREVKKTGRINWVVAGAFTSMRATSDLPPDIWSRFSAQIAIQNPISSPFVTDPHRANYIQALIFSFMLGFALGRKGPNLEKSLGAYSNPQSRVDQVIGNLLLARSGSGGRLSPSPLIILVAQALSKYLGGYSVFSLQLLVKDPETKEHKIEEYSLPRPYCIRSEDADCTGLVFSADWIHPAWQDRYLSLETTPVIRCHDSIRTVRQACHVVFERLFELVLQRAATPGLIAPEQIKKILNEAFTTIDLSRRGNGLERLIGYRHVCDLRFGIEHIVPDGLVSAIAGQANSV